jgi:hypothetical protein
MVFYLELRAPRLSEERAKQRQHVVRVWIAAEHRLRKDQVAVDVHVEDAVSSGD